MLLNAAFPLIPVLAASAAAPRASARPPKWEAAASKACLASFRPTDARRLKAALKNPDVAPHIRRLLPAYASCQSLRSRSSACPLLKVIPGNSDAVCRDYFEQLMLWRDLSAGVEASRLDALDEGLCQRWSVNLVGSPDKGKEVCAAIAEAYAQRRPLCQAFDGLPILPALKAQGPEKCEKRFKSYLEKTSEASPDDVSNAVIDRLWNAAPAPCGEFPFETPAAEGACLGIFEPKACDSLLKDLRGWTCAAEKSR